MQRSERRWSVWVVWVAALLAAAPAIADPADPGPFTPAWRTVTVTRPNASTFTARLYHPATAPGQNQPLDRAGAPYPAVTFGHGFLQPVSRYESTLLHLASHGYLVIASESEGGLFPSHGNFALDMRQCLTWLEQQNAAPGALLEGAVRTSAFGASGHSMGGGAGTLAAAADPRIRAIATLAAAETNPSAIAASAGLRVPASYISGSADTIVPVGTNGQRMYDAAPAPRLLPNIQGGFHCGFQDVSSFGCDGGNGTLTRAEQLAITRRLLTVLFDLHLKGDQGAWRAVWGPEADADPRVVTQRDPGAVMDPAAQSIPAVPGTTAEAIVSVTNTGPVATSFTMLPDAPPWPVEFVPPQTAALGPGAAQTVTVRVAVPASPGPAIGRFTVTARRDADGGTRALALVEVDRGCVGDATGDRRVDFADLNAVLSQFGQSGPPGSLSADFNRDGVVDFADLNTVLSAFGAVC